MKTNPTSSRLNDGDQVILLEPASVSGYWFCQDTMLRGSWEKMYLLPGSIGRVVKARTPCVTTRRGEPTYFANVDIEYKGETHRIRVFHHVLGRVRVPRHNPEGAKT